MELTATGNNMFTSFFGGDNNEWIRLGKFS